MSSFLSQIIISNKTNIPRAEIISIVSHEHELMPNESMRSWIDSGETIESWSRFTSIVKVIDKTDEELQYLLEPLVNSATAEPEIIHARKWYFKEPDVNSDFYKALHDEGEITVMFEQVLPYLMERT